MGVGGDIHVNNVRGRVMMQFGTRSTVVPRNDGSSYKGQYDLQTIYRYISEAYAGYHWNKWHGINLDAGIFMSYIGLFSYNNFENWGYQPSYTSDNTPWFFNGLRLQTFPTDKLKVELWLVNGWQSYGMFNHSPGVGVSIYYRPKENVDYVFNNYYGKDDQGAPDRYRLHLDYSYELRYFNRPNGKFLTKAAFSLTADFGFENGNGVSPFGKTDTKTIDTYLPAQNFISGMIYNRFWFGQHFAFNFGGGYMHNPCIEIDAMPFVPMIAGVGFTDVAINVFEDHIDLCMNFHHFLAQPWSEFQTASSILPRTLFTWSSPPTPHE